MLTPYQEDALREVVNVGIGRAAASLSELIGMRIELTMPRVRLCRLEELNASEAGEGEPWNIVIAQDFDGRITGRASLVFPRHSGLELARLLTGVEHSVDELDLELSGILTEVANIVLNGVLGSLANALDSNLTFSLPWFSGEQKGASLPAILASRFSRPPESLVVADALFQVRQRAISSRLALVFELGSIEAVLATLCATETTA